ncbi:MAG TPA: FAD-binding protein [Verrucomicrobiae bacterium]|nr:FAD-binding protein [Verrucomicrobiae bacterium]
MDLTGLPLTTPADPNAVAVCLRAASAAGERVLVVGGATQLDRADPAPIDRLLSTRALNRVVAYEPAEMIAVVEAGCTIRDLRLLLAPHGQEWPVDAPDEATVGGVIATGAAVPRQLGVGPVRDSVLEVDCITGDGRALHTGGRTVKNVSGYGLPRLLVGSLGTLAVIVQAAVKLRPAPRARRTVTAAGGLLVAEGWLRSVPLATAILVHDNMAELRLEGWPDDVRAQTARARASAPDAAVSDQLAFPALTPWTRHPIVAEVSVAPSQLGRVLAAAGPDAGGLIGIGAGWIGFDDLQALRRVRQQVEALGGVLPVTHGPGGLGGRPPAPAIHRRIKAAFDPAGILAPGRFWAGM